ncbi:MAG: GAF domain-containing sensor histidine kinase [Candidatus Binatota bacterium]
MKPEPKPLDAENEIQILAALSELMGTSMPFEEVIATAMRFTSAMMRADGSSLLLVNRKEGTLSFYIALGEKAEQLKNITLAQGEGIAGFVAETGVPMVVADVSRERRFSQRVDQTTGFKTRSIACVPLRVRDELKGVIEVVSKGVGTFSDKELDMLTAIAGPIAIMIDNARLIDEVRSLHDKLEKAGRVKAEFLATMTHELRTPINIVIGNLDLLLGGYLGELNNRQLDSLKTALRNSGEALNLVGSLLDLSRIEAGQFVIRVEEFGLEDIWAELELLFRIGLSGKEVELTWEVKAPIPPLKTDKIKVKEILSNIVFNAVKFTDRGRIQVVVSPLGGGDEVEMVVEDTGIGIPKDFLPFIFEPFRQAEESITRSHGGVGLGLSIAKRLLNLLHGRVEVESEVGKGSTFRIVIPTKYSA